MASVRCEGVSFRYSKKSAWIIKDLSLQVGEGEFLAVVGSSGCGKSTLLRLIAGLEKPERGEVRFDRKDVTSVPAQKRDVAIVFQSPCLYPHLDAAGNIAMALKIAKEKEVERKVLEAARMCGIEGLLSRFSCELSGGQKQRVAIARALARRPGLFLMDEPLSSLDENLRFQMRREIRELQKRTGISAIYVTHDQVEALSMADRLAVMRDGRIEQLGSPDEVYKNPANAFVASFLGQPPMNLVSVRAEGGKFLLGGIVFAAPASGRFTLGFRPEDAKIGEEGAQIEVLGCENMGKEFWIRGSIAGGGGQVFISSRSPLPPGRKAKISISPESLRFFDLDGARIAS